MSDPISGQHLVVLGAGFAALSTVREVRKHDRNVRITVIAPRAELHYLPGIIWIPCGLRAREDLVVPLHNFFQRMNVQFIQAEVQGLAVAGESAELAALGRLPDLTFDP